MSSLSPSWRTLLGMLTEHSTERQRVAEALGVNTYTVTRWVTGETEPRAGSLKKLPDIFPSPYREQLLELVQAEFFPHLSPQLPTITDRSMPQIPLEYLVRAISAIATTSGPFRAWSLRHLTLQQAIEQLDPDAHGMEITVVQCVPPTSGCLIRSLCERTGVGTAPWVTGVGGRLLFLGAESLAGWTVGRGEPGVVQDLQQKQGLLPVRPGLYEKAAAAWPLQRADKLAGCLLVSSTQVDYFTPARLSLLEVYANTLALSFHDEEFYALHTIGLHVMPVLSQQDEYTSMARFHERVTYFRRERAYQISVAEAEVLALQQMEAELLQTHS